MLLNETEAQSICQRLLGFVRADDAEVSVESEDFSHLRFAANRFTTSGRRENATASVTVWLDQKRGSAAVNGLDEAALKGVVAEAEGLARVSPVDREYVPTLGPQRYRPTGGYVEATVKGSLSERAKDIHEIIRACEQAGVIGAGFHQTRGTAAGLASKHGNFHYQRASLVSLSVTARTPDGGGSGFFLRNHFDVAKFDPGRIGREAIQRALRAKDPRPLEPGIYAVILEAQAAEDLLRFDFDARSADEGRSPYSAPGGATRLGETIFDERLSISSDPWHLDVPASSAAEDGVPAQQLYCVRHGILENLRYSRFWAKEKGKEATPGPVNTILESSAAPVSVEEMIKSTERGLLVSRFWYIRSVDPRTALFTGLTRDGLWYIEGGKIQYPVRNFRFNQSLLQLLAPGNVEMIGAPERVSPSETQGRGASLTPALKVKQFHFTSPSEAV